MFFNLQDIKNALMMERITGGQKYIVVAGKCQFCRKRMDGKLIPVFQDMTATETFAAWWNETQEYCKVYT